MNTQKGFFRIRPPVQLRTTNYLLSLSVDSKSDTNKVLLHIAINEEDFGLKLSSNTKV